MLHIPKYQLNQSTRNFTMTDYSKEPIKGLDPRPPHTDPLNINHSVTKQVCYAMAAIKQVPKSSFNAFAKYHYASADDVFSVIRPILAEHNLEIRATEVDREVVQHHDGKNWMLISYEIGFVGGNFDRRTIYVPLNSSQSLQAAATYAVKYWLRTKLLIDTGEADLDANGDEARDPVVKGKPIAHAANKKPAKPKMPAPVSRTPIWSLGDDGLMKQNKSSKPAGKQDVGNLSPEWKAWVEQSQRDLYREGLRNIDAADEPGKFWKVNKAQFHMYLPKKGYMALNNAAAEALKANGGGDEVSTAS